MNFALNIKRLNDVLNGAQTHLAELFGRGRWGVQVVGWPVVCAPFAPAPSSVSATARLFSQRSKDGPFTRWEKHWEYFVP